MICKNKAASFEGEHRLIKPFRCPHCHSRICDVRIWSHKAQARISFMYTDEMHGDISLHCRKCNQQVWMSIT